MARGISGDAGAVNAAQAVVIQSGAADTPRPGTDAAKWLSDAAKWLSTGLGDQKVPSAGFGGSTAPRRGKGELNISKDGKVIGAEAGELGAENQGARLGGTQDAKGDFAQAAKEHGTRDARGYGAQQATPAGAAVAADRSLRRTALETPRAAWCVASSPSLLHAVRRSSTPRAVSRGRKSSLRHRSWSTRCFSTARGMWISRFGFLTKARRWRVRPAVRRFCRGFAAGAQGFVWVALPLL